MVGRHHRGNRQYTARQGAARACGAASPLTWLEILCARRRAQALRSSDAGQRKTFITAIAPALALATPSSPLSARSDESCCRRSGCFRRWRRNSAAQGFTGKLNYELCSVLRVSLRPGVSSTPRLYVTKSSRELPLVAMLPSPLLLCRAARAAAGSPFARPFARCLCAALARAKRSRSVQRRSRVCTCANRPPRLHDARRAKFARLRANSFARSVCTQFANI